MNEAQTFADYLASPEHAGNAPLVMAQAIAACRQNRDSCQFKIPPAPSADGPTFTIAFADGSKAVLELTGMRFLTVIKPIAP